MRVALAALALAAGCAAETELPPRQEARQWALANATPVGEPEDCILRRNVGHTVVLDDRTVDFHMSDGRLMRSRLPDACPGLAFDESFFYRTSLDRLCASDLITVRTSTGPGPTCGLGAFQRVEIARR
ncbi:MAG: hypothetical protein M3N07_02875 [Pseudomonadota bacterium]|nr:hypothetical protein [Pseudomonadota bacterium]